MNTYDNIVKYGDIYFPANKHYAGFGTVTCNRCKRRNLNICVGWKNQDLCLSCTANIANRLRPRNQYLVSRIRTLVLGYETDSSDEDDY